ncbi:unnamed protein product [Gadus morhua 'NCC']
MIIPESELVAVLITRPPRYRPYRDGSQVRASEPGRSHVSPPSLCRPHEAGLPKASDLRAASYRDVCSLAVLVPLSLKGQRLSERQIGGRLTLRSLSHPEEPWMEQNNTRLLHTTHFPVPLDQSMSVTSPEELLGHGCVV